MTSTTPLTRLHHAIMPNLKPISVLTACCLLVLAPATRADDSGPGIKFTGSGFLTLAAGKVLSGSGEDANTIKNSYGYHSPSFVADYGQGGVYETGGWSMNPDSKLGLQGSVAFNDSFSITGQIVARGARDGKINLEWVYANYKLNDKVTLQAGRKRLPLFYYSESQDVGLSMPWVRLPPQVYGWEIVNYNGANVLYRDKWSNGWTSSLNVFAGSETRKENGFWEIYNGKHSRTDSRWSNIVGAELSVSPYDWLETRVVAIQSNIQNRTVEDNGGNNVDTGFSPKARQRIYGLSVSADYENWVGRAEFLAIDRKETYGGDHAQLLAVGYRFGKFLPMLTYANYKQTIDRNNPDGADPKGFEAHDTLAASLRYDLTTSSAIKVQFDHWRDKGGSAFDPPYGSSNLLSVSYDLVF